MDIEYTAIIKHYKKVIDMKKTILSIVLIAALLIACSNIEIDFADPIDVQNAISSQSNIASGQNPTTQQRPAENKQNVEMPRKIKPIAENETNTNVDQPNELSPISDEDHVLSAAPTNDDEPKSDIPPVQPPESQPDPAPTPTAPSAYGSIPFYLSARTGTWWSIDATDSAYWAVQQSINTLRTAGGLPELTMDDGLSAIASARCESIVAGGPFDHSGMITKSEILATGPLRSASDACAAWQASEVHYANIMRTDISRMGVGCWFCEVDGNQYAHWAVTFE